MSSRTSTLHGSQAPRLKREPRHRETDGPYACELAASYGLVPDEWQEMVLDCWLGRNAYMKWTANECGLVVPRQNGKNAVLEMRELYGIAVLGESILHTAHQVRTARESFMRLCAFFENERWPELLGMVESIRRANGQEAVMLTNGGSVRFVARSRTSARGITADVLVLDEAQELTAEQIEALQPTLSAAPLKNPQVIMTGTSPGPQAPGEVLRRWRENAVAGTGKRNCWHEWSVEDFGDIADRSRWYAANPALGTRISLAAVESELQTMSADGFARERLGWWQKSADSAMIGKGEWERLVCEDPPMQGRLAYGVKFAPDGASVALCAAVGPKGGGAVHVECIEHRSMASGSSWLCDWLMERRRLPAAVVIDGLYGAQRWQTRWRRRASPKRRSCAPGSPTWWRHRRCSWTPCAKGGCRTSGSPPSTWPCWARSAAR